MTEREASDPDFVSLLGVVSDRQGRRGSDDPPVTRARGEDGADQGVVLPDPEPDRMTFPRAED